MSFRGAIGSGAITGPGAVGGARGTAAGALRVIMEFVTQYDGAAVKQLEQDLAALSAQEGASGGKLLASERALQTLQRRKLDTDKQLARQIALQGKGAKQLRTELREISKLGPLTKEGKTELSSIRQRLGANEQITRLVTKQATQARAIAGFTTRAKNDEVVHKAVLEQEVAVQQQLTRFQQLKANVVPRLAGLVTGAIGGIFGGALIGVGFAAAQAVLDNLEQGLDDLFDPARHARDAIKEVGEAIEGLSEGGDRLKGAEAFLKSLGIQADKTTVSILAQATADLTGAKSLEARKQIMEIINHQEQLHAQLIRDNVVQLAKERDINIELDATRRARHLPELGAPLAAEAERNLAAATDAASQAARQAAADANQLAFAQRQQAAAAQLAAFAEQNLVGALQRAAGLKLRGFDARIEGLQASGGESSRTRAIQKKIDALQNSPSGDSGRARQQQLANISEQRAIILLRQRLRLLGTNINLEKYSGKFLLEAINAKLKALQKEAAAQDRLNRLLDLQYKMAQTLRRNEGESISDFIERRAQENRGFLTEQRDIEREAAEEKLNELKDRTDDEVALRELAEQRKTASQVQGTDHRMELLRKELAASQKADAAALKSKITAIEKQKKAYQDLSETAEEYATETKNTQVRLAISAVKTISDLSKLSGQISGLTAAKAFLSALLTSGALSGSDYNAVKEALARVTATLSQYDAKADKLATRGGRTHYAKGGLIPLTNASSPLGSNIRFGDGGGGTEYGLVFQQSIAKGLKESMGKGIGQVGPFYLDRGDNWVKDRYEMKRLVMDAVREAVG